jgi:hypothetical protein
LKPSANNLLVDTNKMCGVLYKELSFDPTNKNKTMGVLFFTWLTVTQMTMDIIYVEE